MTNPGFTFTPIGLGRGSDRVTVTPNGITYSRRFGNWLTWTVVICTAGLAFCVWPWIRFGHQTETLMRSQISSMSMDNRGRGVVLRITSLTGVVSFRTDRATAERAQLLLSQ